jgi:hypothetical protein
MISLESVTLLFKGWLEGERRVYLRVKDEGVTLTCFGSFRPARAGVVAIAIGDNESVLFDWTLADFSFEFTDVPARIRDGEEGRFESAVFAVCGELAIAVFLLEEVDM